MNSSNSKTCNRNIDIIVNPDIQQQIPDINRFVVCNISEPMKWSYVTLCLGLVLFVFMLFSAQESNESVQLGMSFTITETMESTLEPDDIERGQSKVILNYYTNQVHIHEGLDDSKTSKGHAKLLKVDPKQGHDPYLEQVKHEVTTQDTLNEGDGEMDPSPNDRVVSDNESVQKVVLLTYFRGGSTFLGEVFNQNPDIFYWFEPLAAPMFAYKREQFTKDYMVDEYENAVSRPPRLVDTLLGVTRDILECNIDDLDRDVMKHYFTTAWRKSDKFYKYQACIFRYKLRHDDNITDEAVEICQKYLKNPCQRSDIRVIKSIRLFVAEAVPLVRHDRSVTLVYYIRDPRGVLLSRFSLGKRALSDIPLSKVTQMAAYLCAKMRTDLAVAQKLKELRPEQIIMLRYEDLALAPVDTVIELYRFLKIELPADVVSWIEYTTHARRSDGSIGTRRSNATAVATRWQTELPNIHLSIIGRHCGDVIDKMYSIPFGYDRGFRPN